MEAIIFCGIQATGKSTFYKEYFFNTHVRISMDLLNTRNKEAKFIGTCLAIQQRFVVDNTNPGKEERYKYIDVAKKEGYKIIGYYFQSKIEDSIKRNSEREGKQKIPDAGIRAAYAKLELPSIDEGFDELYYVEIVEGRFVIKNWDNEI